MQESFLPCPWTNKFALIFVSLNLPSHIFATAQIHGQGMQCTLYYLASGSRFGIAGYFENSPRRAKLQLFRCAIISTNSHWSILFSVFKTFVKVRLYAIRVVVILKLLLFILNIILPIFLPVLMVCSADEKTAPYLYLYLPSAGRQGGHL